MKPNQFLFNALLVFLAIYFWRNILFWVAMIVYGNDTHDIILNLALAVVEGLSLIIITKNRKLIKTGLIHKICLFWFITMFLVLTYNHDPFSAYMKCLLWPILFESIYICTLRVKNVRKGLYRLFVCLFALGCYYFAVSLIQRGFEGASNVVYFVILTIPMILATRNNKNNMWILIITSGIALISMKRSMMLAMILYWSVIFLVNAFKKGKIIQSLFLVGILSISAIFAYGFVDNLSGGNISKRNEREDITNGREAIYLVTIDMISKSSISHQILGNGHNAVRRDSSMDISAHNEWLEVIYDYGIILLGLYLLLWSYMTGKCYQLLKLGSRYFEPMLLCVCVWSVMSMVSQLLVYISYVIYLFVFLAFVEARTKRIPIINSK